MNPVITLPEEDIQLLEDGLRTGLGLTKSASLLRIEAKTVSDFLKSNEEVYNRALNAIRDAAHAMIKRNAAHVKKQEWEQWEANTQNIRVFVNELVLWESICKKEEVNPGIILAAYGKFKVWEEVGTACGFTALEMQAYLNRNPRITLYIKQNPALYQ